MVRRTLLFTLFLPFLLWSFTPSSSIEPGDIKVSIINDDVIIEWTGFSGINSYQVEVATDVDNSGQLIFKKLAEVKNNKNEYLFSYTDKSSGKSGIRYYRVKHLKSDKKYILSEVKTANFLFKKNFTLNLQPDYNNHEILLEVNSKFTGDAAIKIVGLSTDLLFEDQLNIKNGFNKMHIKIPDKLNDGIVLFSFSYNGDTQHVMLRKNPVQNYMVVSEE